jgi:hypothetical protein
MNEITQPYYYIDFSASECFFEIRINDVPALCFDMDKQVSTAMPVNHLILEPGKQMVEIIILPNLGNIKFDKNAYFKASLQLRDVLNKFELINEKQLYSFEAENSELPAVNHKDSFIADVPFKINSWQFSQNLKDIDDIRELVDNTYRNIENTIANKQFAQLINMLKKREDNIGKAMYLSEIAKNKRMAGLLEDFENGFIIEPTTPKDILNFCGYGKLAYLRKQTGESALKLVNKQTEEEMNIEIMLHLEKGATELSII